MACQKPWGPPTNWAHLKVINEIEDQTDRGAAIIGAAYLEERLLEAIKSRLYQPELPGQHSLYDSANGPIATFNAKIDLGYALALFGQKVHRDLHLIRQIRNSFAHNFDPTTFSTEPIAQRCSELWLPQHVLQFGGKRTSPTDHRGQYLHAVYMIFEFLRTEMEHAPEWKGPVVMKW